MAQVHDGRRDHTVAPVAEDPRRDSTCSRGNSAISTTPSPTCSASTRCSSACRSSMRCAPTGCRIAGSRSSRRATIEVPPRSRDDGVGAATTAGRRRGRARPVVAPPSLRCHFDALPFDAASLDLVILPHALELARDPHLALREVERVLVPEGRVIIVGFNPASLWGTRQRLGRMRRRLVAHLGRAVPAARRRVRRLPAPARLAAPAQLRGRGRPLRLLHPAAHLGALARPLRLDGARRRALVAGVRRALLHRRRQAGARHAAGRPDPQGRARRRP